MTSSPTSDPPPDERKDSVQVGERRIGRIPVRNLWLLMLYASDLARYKGRFQAALERDVANLPDLVGQLLSREVVRRIRRNLTRGYRHRVAEITRVRGRILPLATLSRRLLDRGEVACRFDELTINTPRNRFIRAALHRLGRLVQSESLALRCRSLAFDLGHAGVSGHAPSRAELATESIGRNDAEDHFMLALARLAFDLALPTEDQGTSGFTSPDREERWVRRLFERAVHGFYACELGPLGWTVSGGSMLEWQQEAPTDGILQILPSMRTDVILDDPEGQRIVMDTKFTGIVQQGWHREETLKSSYIYQIYAYLRSQEQPQEAESPWNRATGILLHPSIERDLDERVTIQSHVLRFVTVDLSAKPETIRERLRVIVAGAGS